MNVIQRIHQLDVFVFSWFMARKNGKRLARIGRFISFSADGPLYVVTDIVLWHFHYRLLASIIAFGFALERCLYFAIKLGFKRNRPADTLKNFHSYITPSDKFSFPSGHTSGAFFVAYCLAQAFPSYYLLFYIWATHVGLSRLLLGVHFPTDTLMGALLGVGCAALMVALLHGILPY
ncbi:phosphatidylglycerophosphatase B [Marinomonas spartinae]|uniref:phosphatase PAP2 family protein n=1 Tax=Marinomonas spartinae TaxID=1792290 RepID=UPI000808EB4D|nr:phosphatase PAP2 family protein [Marinomonas spartinae]MBJ7555998.1 phosphatase PAP2 family protein [Marinomonas spartinae]SBS34891.1 phosphatidylglycerophosphatase B [Marinomonas spartinae]